MPRSLCLTRQCLGLVTRIECSIRPLAGESGRWTLICAAGMSAAQPSAIKAQGPFYGPQAAEEVLAAIVESLAVQGYEQCDELPIWSLHIQAELRRLNDAQRRYPGQYRFRPDTDGQS
ncbi:PA4575 family protein [Pseudomonas sp. NCHU5208]|uniref:PA4575 family protein n=1 Tax=unclassified Pseudomonas TaxID=196821 RepID=UPI003F98EC5D